MKIIGYFTTILLCFVNVMAFAANPIPSISFLDERVIDANQTFKNTTVGGLSSIDYHDGMVYMISDHGHYDKPTVLGKPRFYQAKLELTDNKISDFQLVDVFELLPNKRSSLGIDPESLRVVSGTNQYIWSSEGDVNKGISPSVYLSTLGQTPSRLDSVIRLPSYFDLGPKVESQKGPYHNAAFEGLDVSIDKTGYWLAMEGPLKQDGHEPSEENGALVRLSFVDMQSGQIKQQFAVPVEPLPVEPNATEKAFRTTGIVEVLQYDTTRFITIERAYTSGLADGGNRVKLFLVDIQGATDIKAIPSLLKQNIVVAKKELILDLADIQHQLNSTRIDNIEGLSFGPRTASGKQTLILVSDNNFNAYEQQLTQLILLQID